MLLVKPPRILPKIQSFLPKYGLVSNETQKNICGGHFGQFQKVSSFQVFQVFPISPTISAVNNYRRGKLANIKCKRVFNFGTHLDKKYCLVLITFENTDCNYLWKHGLKTRIAITFENRDCNYLWKHGLQLPLKTRIAITFENTDCSLGISVASDSLFSESNRKSTLW